MLRSAQTYVFVMFYSVSVWVPAHGGYAAAVNIGVTSQSSSTLSGFWQQRQRRITGQQNQRRHSVKACNQKQQLAQAVLHHVATGPRLQKLELHKQQSRGSSSTTPGPHQATNAPLSVIAAAAAIDNNTTPLQQHIHLLHTPPTPSAWWQLCDAISSKHLSGLKSGLMPQQKLLPDVQHAAAARCQLGRYPWGYCFADISLSAFIAALFYSIIAGRAAAAKQLGAPAPQLDRFDLFHGHIFTAWDCSMDNRGSTFQPIAAGDGRNSLTDRLMVHMTSEQQMHQQISSNSSGCSVGILFHAAEYPSYDADVFPHNLGHCQVNSSCSFNQRSQDLRNIIWWKGQLAVLDVGAGSPLHALLHEGTAPFRTLYEEDFGRAVADVLLLKQQQRRRRKLAAEQQRLQRLYSAQASYTARRLGVMNSSHQHPGVYVSY